MKDKLMIETVNISRKRHDELAKFWNNNHPSANAKPDKDWILASAGVVGQWYYSDGEWFRLLRKDSQGYGYFLSVTDPTRLACMCSGAIYPIATETELEEKPRLDDDGNEIPHWKKHMCDRLFEEDDKMKKDILCPECSSSNISCIGGFSLPGFFNDKFLECKTCQHQWRVSQTELDGKEKEPPWLSCPLCSEGILDWHSDNPKHPYAVCCHCKVKLALVPERSDGECIIEDLKVGERFIERGKEWVKRENVTKLHSGEVLCVALDVKANIDFVVDPKWPCTRVTKEVE